MNTVTDRGPRSTIDDEPGGRRADSGRAPRPAGSGAEEGVKVEADPSTALSPRPAMAAIPDSDAAAALLQRLHGPLLRVAGRVEAALGPLPPGAPAPTSPDRFGCVPYLLIGEVVPRFQAEEEVLYPIVEEDADVAFLRSQHRTIRGWIESVSLLTRRLQLSRCPSRSTERVLRGQLHDLCSLLRRHVHDEAQACSPALRRVGPERGEELWGALADSGRRARREVRLVIAQAPGATEAVVLRSNPGAGRVHVVELGQLDLQVEPQRAGLSEVEARTASESDLAPP